MVKGEKGGYSGVTVALRNAGYQSPVREGEAVGGEKRSARFGNSSYYASHFPPEMFQGPGSRGKRGGGKSWESKPGRGAEGGESLTLCQMLLHYAFYFVCDLRHSATPSLVSPSGR